MAKLCTNLSGKKFFKVSLLLTHELMSRVCVCVCVCVWGCTGSLDMLEYKVMRLLMNSQGAALF